MRIRDELEISRCLQGRAQAIAQRDRPIHRIGDAEFRVFSQFGDDGILQFLISRIGLRDQSFVEFGVENYRESNTRFLLVNDNWRGLVIDGSKRNIRDIHHSSLYWRHDLTAIHAFITRDNINDLLAANGFSGQIGLLSIDLDGVDYWVWEKLTVVQPQIVVAEYNALFGVERAVTVPYNPKFVREKAHYSNLYWGCSLPALNRIAESRGYQFVGCNSAGNNAYFVKRSATASLPCPSLVEGFVESKFRESRDENGALSFVSGAERLNLILKQPLIDLETGDTILVSDL